jgi:glycosyltransferase involved in cell wall biosynthesis
MAELKSAYQLSLERIIVPRKVYQKVEENARKIDFIDIPEFSDRENKTIEDSVETKIIDPDKEEDIPMSNIRTQESQTFHNNEIEVHWAGNVMDFGGFARMNRTMIFGLSNRNVKIKVDIEPYITHVNKATQEQLRELSNQFVSPTAPKVFGVTIPTNPNHAGKKILYTMIETSEKVHKDYAEKLNLMSEIWVASEYGKKIIKRSNVCVPIYVMPLGVDTERYKPNCGTMDFGPATRDFKFLSVFRWGFRKGYDILLKAYLEEFSSDDNVSLVIVSRNLDRMEETGPQKIIDDFRDMRSFIKKTDDQLPHVALYTKPIEEKDMPKVYSSCNAYTILSRGEGMNLPLLEAAATGLPVIASNVTAHQDYLKEDNSFLVEPDGYLEARVGGTMSNMAKGCHFYEGQMFPDFSNNSIEQTKAHMRFVYENYNESKEKADKLRKLIVNNYTWEMAVDRVYSRLLDLN